MTHTTTATNPEHRRTARAPARNGQRPGPPAISIRGLRKTWSGGVEAVKGIDLDVATGEVFGLLGPNGAGKSTTIGMLTTTVRPTAGQATICGHDVAADPIAARAVSAVVFQDPVVDVVLSGRRNLELHARLWGASRSDAVRAVDDLVDRLELGSIVDRPVGTYSGGQRRRLEIGRALLSRPRVLFLDEPTVGLDARVRADLLDLVAGLRDRTGMTVVLTTHLLDEAERLCDRIAIVHGGRVVTVDTPARLIASIPATVIELRVSGSGSEALDDLRRAGVDEDQSLAIGSTVTIPVAEDRAAQVRKAIEHGGIATTALTVRRSTLDDVYLRLTGDDLHAHAA